MGILDNIFGPEGAKFRQYAGNTLSDLGYGFANSTNAGDAFGAATRIQAARQPARDAADASAAEAAARQKQITDTTKYLQAKFPDLAAAVSSGLPLSDAWSEAMKRSQPGYGVRDPIKMGKGDTLIDPVTHQPIYTAPDSEGSGAVGPYAGTGMDAQNWNILLDPKSDPGSQEYAAAWAQLNQPKITYQQGPNGLVPVIQNPDIPANIRRPFGAKPAAAPLPAPAPLAGPTTIPGLSPGGSDLGAPAPQNVGGITSGSPIPGTEPKPTEQQSRNTAIGEILLNEIPTVNQNFQALADPKGQLLSKLGPLGNAWQSAEYQKASSAVAATVSNVLYSLSGASSNPGEVVKQIEVLTPKYGDKPATIASKLQRFNAYVNAIASQSGDPKLIAAIQQATANMSSTAGGKVTDMGNGVTIEEVP